MKTARTQKKFGEISRERTEQYIALAKKIAYENQSRFFSTEERVNYALEGIARGLDTFVQNRKTDEAFWCYVKGTSLLRDKIRKAHRTRKRRQNERLVSDVEEVQEITEDKPQRYYVSSDEWKFMFVPALRSLDLRTRQIFCRCYLNGESQKNVGLSLGISQSTVSRIKKRGLQLIKTWIAQSPYRNVKLDA